MSRYYVGIEAKDGELEAILNEMDAARATIEKCCCELRNLGVLIIRKDEEAASGN